MKPLFAQRLPRDRSFTGNRATRDNLRSPWGRAETLPLTTFEFGLARGHLAEGSTTEHDRKFRSLSPAEKAATYPETRAPRGHEKEGRATDDKDYRDETAAVFVEYDPNQKILGVDYPERAPPYHPESPDPG